MLVFCQCNLADRKIVDVSQKMLFYDPTSKVSGGKAPSPKFGKFAQDHTAPDFINAVDTTDREAFSIGTHNVGNNSLNLFTGLYSIVPAEHFRHTKNGQLQMLRPTVTQSDNFSRSVQD